MSLAYPAVSLGEAEQDYHERLVTGLELALRSRGFGADSPARIRRPFAEAGVATLFWLALSVAFVLPVMFGLSGWPYALLLAASLACVAAVFATLRWGSYDGALSTAAGVAATAFVAVAAVYGVIEIVLRHGGSLARAYIAPLLIVLAVWLAMRKRDILGPLRAVPLFLPLIVGAPLVSLFSADVWQVAAALDLTRGLPLVALSALFSLLLWMVVTRRLRASIRDVFEETAGKLAADPAAVDEAMQLMEKDPRLRDLLRLGPTLFAVGGARRATQSQGPFADYTRTVIQPAFGPPAIRYADLALKKLEGTFKRKVTVRFTAMVASVAAALWVFIYATAALAVDVDVAKTWTVRDVDHLVVAPIRVDVPMGPYILMAVFLSVAATMIFLVLSLTRQEHSNSLAENLLRRPIRECLLLEIPFEHLNRVDPQSGLPLNDDFSTAHVLTGTGGTVYGTYLAASNARSDERDYASKGGGNQAWWRWEAPTSGPAVIDTFGSTFDTLLAVHTGPAHAELQLVAANDDAAGLLQSEVKFEAVEGTEYHIAVDGYGDAAGDIVLNWRIPPPNDDCGKALLLTGRVGRVEGENRGATSEPGEPEHAGVPCGQSVWYRWIAPNTATVAFDTDGSTFDTVLAVYRGNAPDALEPVAANDDAGDGRHSLVEFDAHEGVEYTIAVAGYADSRGDFVLTWRVPPANDDFDAALPLSGPNGTVSGDNLGAGSETDEPQHAGNERGASVWYRWTTPVRGSVFFEVFSTEFDVLLAVYRGSRVDDLELVGDHGGTGRRFVTFDAEPDVEYSVAVDGRDGATGAMVLRWELTALPPAPPNDTLAAAEVLEGPTGTATTATGGAGREPREPVHAGKPGGRSVWYRWTAPATGTAVFDTFGSDFDTLLAVYRGSSFDEFEVVAQNDDAELRTQSRVEFGVEGGTSYAIVVDGYHGASGSAVLNWRLEA